MDIISYFIGVALIGVFLHNSRISLALAFVFVDSNSISHFPACTYLPIPLPKKTKKSSHEKNYIIYKFKINNKKESI